MNCSWKGVRMQRGDDACCLSGLFFENIYCCSTVQFRKPPLYICRISLGPTEKFLEIPFASVGFFVFLRCNPANLRFIIRRISLGLTEKFLKSFFISVEPLSILRRNCAIPLFASVQFAFQRTIHQSFHYPSVQERTSAGYGS